MIVNGIYLFKHTETWNEQSIELYPSELNVKGKESILNKIAPEYLESNVLFVDFHQNQNWDYETDVTYEQLLEAFNAGRCIIGRVYDRDGNLKYTTRNVNVEHVIPLND